MKTILVAAISLLIAACSSNPLPDLNRLYGDTPDLQALHEKSAQDDFQNPVILLHGILGSRLRRADSREEIWPGGLTDLLFSNFRDRPTWTGFIVALKSTSSGLGVLSGRYRSAPNNHPSATWCLAGTAS